MTPLLMLSFATFQAQTGTGIYTPVVALNGHDAHFTKPSIRLIHQNEDWRAWWAEMKGVRKDRLGPNEPPAVDFKQYSVCAVAQGPSTNSNGIAFNDGISGGGGYTLRYTNMSFQSGREGVPSNPWGIAVVPRPGPSILYKTVMVVVEENVQDMIGKEPVWKKRAEFTIGQ